MYISVADLLRPLCSYFTLTFQWWFHGFISQGRFTDGGNSRPCLCNVCWNSRGDPLGSFKAVEDCVSHTEFISVLAGLQQKHKQLWHRFFLITPCIYPLFELSAVDLLHPLSTHFPADVHSKDLCGISHGGFHDGENSGPSLRNER